MRRAATAQTRCPRRGKGPHRAITSRCGSLFLRTTFSPRAAVFRVRLMVFQGRAQHIHHGVSCDHPWSDGNIVPEQEDTHEIRRINRRRALLLPQCRH